MAVSAGRRLGPYEIVSPIGAGGMGEVYKARDARLNRFVAIKVLPEDVSADPDRLHRFEREARAASALNHPNIVTVHDVGVAGSTSYLAMELVEGKTLRDLLLPGPLSIKKLLDIAAQIADGLAAAHEAGIVHRDLKPRNVIVTREGQVKIVDFGLAKVPAPSDADLGKSGASTLSERGTLSGEVVGTVEYMSPEQARGKPIDYRSDQFSFGTLLYEMVTGRHAFARNTPADTLVAVLQQEPSPVGELRPEVPAPFRWIIERCLAKAPEDRYSSTRDLGHDLASLRGHLSEMTGPPGGGPPSQRIESTSQKRFARRLAASILVVGGAIATLLVLKQTRLSGMAVRFTIPPPQNTTFNFSSTAPAPAVLSPDGRRIAFGVRDSSGNNVLSVRPLDALTARVLIGTEAATYPFWSPDSLSLGFFANGQLKRIEIDGGPAQVLCSAPEGRGGSWSHKGVIIFAPDPRGPVTKVAAAGGECSAITQLDSRRPHMVHRWPYFLPDGNHFLYLVHDPDPSSQEGVWIGSLESKKTERILNVVSNVAYSPPGYVLFVRDGALFAVPFDATRLRVTGAPASVVREVRYQPYRWHGLFSVSGTGVLAYQTGLAIETSQLVWFDRSGKQFGSLGSAADYEGLRLSPDGSRCAVEVRDPRSAAIDIWIGDVSRGITTRLTKGETINDSPVWSPDGERIVFSSNRSGLWKIYEVASRGDRSDRPIFESEDGTAPTDWSSDERLIAFHRSGPSTRYKWQIWKWNAMDKVASPLIQQSSNQTSARFSPDNRWIAYCSDESGNQEIYVQAATGSGGKWQISKGGGSQPVWRRDGKELFYLAPDSRLMAAAVQTGASFRVGDVRALFPIRIRDSASDIPLFDVSPDGERFLVNSRIEGESAPPLTVVMNWVSDLKR